ncbi:hypothetical protein BDP55DRAFT_683329 [Colletotrichum godetiae]|uniref:Uncharacterized protein n=1 Tax=Colletotrichum godetiae TaxID=1209918 RepID=A0AAJ0A817_9PEZI|nr:uncharacterized protein BDP55DRAFT_683329 [Colletotrichum godetiae]KAK1658205.1 hypothetical protein BDP55DRAFT_683329 [Colletotrichum godetiae]
MESLYGLPESSTTQWTDWFNCPTVLTGYFVGMRRRSSGDEKMNDKRDGRLLSRRLMSIVSSLSLRP